MNRQWHIFGYIFITTPSVRARRVHLNSRKKNDMPFGTDWTREDEP